MEYLNVTITDCAHLHKSKFRRILNRKREWPHLSAASCWISPWRQQSHPLPRWRHSHQRRMRERREKRRKRKERMERREEEEEAGEWRKEGEEDEGGVESGFGREGNEETNCVDERQCGYDEDECVCVNAIGCGVANEEEFDPSDDVTDWPQSISLNPKSLDGISIPHERVLEWSTSSSSMWCDAGVRMNLFAVCSVSSSASLMSLFVPLEGKINSLRSFWGNVSAEKPKEASRSPALCDSEKFDCEFVTSDGTKR